jgi:hypothetical protein
MRPLTASIFIKGDFAFGKQVVQIFNNRVIFDAGRKQENLLLEDTSFMICKNIQN